MAAGAAEKIRPLRRVEYDKLVALGVFEGERIELIDGALVAESSLSYDRGRKARLYAECGVPEYWIVNLVERAVEVHRRPSAGNYDEITVHPKGSRLRLVAFPDVELSVDDFLR
jgi:Uma2 family endonuclease